MIRELIALIIASLSPNQAQAMMDPDGKTGLSTLSSSPVKQTFLDGGKEVLTTSPSTINDHTRRTYSVPDRHHLTQHKQIDRIPRIKDNERTRIADLETRIAALELNADDARVGEPQNIRQVTEVNPPTPDDDFFDESLYGEPLFVRENPYLEK